MSPPSTQARSLIDLVLGGSHTCSHHCCEFMCAMALKCPANLVSLQISTTSGSYSISFPLLQLSLILEGKERDTNVLFRVEHFKVFFEH